MAALLWLRLYQAEFAQDRLATALHRSLEHADGVVPAAENQLSSAAEENVQSESPSLDQGAVPGGRVAAMPARRGFDRDRSRSRSRARAPRTPTPEESRMFAWHAQLVQLRHDLEAFRSESRVRMGNLSWHSDRHGDLGNTLRSRLDSLERRFAGIQEEIGDVHLQIAHILQWMRMH